MHLRLIGEKVILRDWIPDDLVHFRNSYTERSNKWMEYDGPYFPRPVPEEIEKRISFIEKIIHAENLSDPRTQLVIANKEDDSMLGLVTWYWIGRESHWKAAGITLYNAGKWGKGLGRDAMLLWVNYLFQSDPQLHRLDLRTWSGNFRMINLARRLGFKEEARFREARMVRGERYDSLGFGLLRKEWEEWETKELSLA